MARSRSLLTVSASTRPAACAPEPILGVSSKITKFASASGAAKASEATVVSGQLWLPAGPDGRGSVFRVNETQREAVMIEWQTSWPDNAMAIGQLGSSIIGNAPMN
jgi:hypothetical protein